MNDDCPSNAFDEQDIIDALKEPKPIGPEMDLEDYIAKYDEHGRPRGTDPEQN